jgi:cysteine synthase A
VPGNLEPDRALIDDAVQVTDEEALEQVFDLQIHEGISIGGSAGVNVAAAIKVAKALGPGHRVVTLLCDGGARYQSKLFNPEFLRGKGLPVPSWLA